MMRIADCLCLWFSQQKVKNSDHANHFRIARVLFQIQLRFRYPHHHDVHAFPFMHFLSCISFHAFPFMHFCSEKSA